VEIGTVKQIDIDKEVQAAYLDYAMSVIVARALPDVRDGLKPVHRRILYAMHDMGLGADKPFRKSARIVGEVLGKYHPHGDAAVYESMVRMAQDFSMRYPLVDGQGNFGSIDGDEAAAMRYTEARLAPLAGEMLADIDKETVEFGLNFDGTLTEPLVLPSALPNFLVNGAAGIAVGMATSVPPHNLAEVCDALCYMIQRYDQLDGVTVEDLMQFIKGPDFPTGGIVYRYEREAGTDGAGLVDVIKAAYAVGRGRFVVQARAHLEEMSRSRSRIVVTELPYQVNKTRLVERIAELVREGRLDGVADLRDESDRQGMRLVIELTRTVEPKDVLSKLYKLTPMQMTFSVNILALVDGEPRTLSLKRALWHYLEHRREIVRRRSAYELELARRQAHILEGLLVALDNLDAVIQTIRQSQNADTARANLMKKFKLTEIQAQAILDMPLRRLAALEQRKIRQEYQEKLERIAYLKDLLAHERKILAVVASELTQLREKYRDARRTQIVDRTSDIVLARDLVEEEAVIVAVSGDKVWREPLAGRRRGAALAAGPAGLAAAAVGYTTGDLVLFTGDGRGVLVPVHQVPAGNQAAITIGELLNASVDAQVSAALILPAEKRAEETPAGYVLLVSAQGKVKRSTLAELYGAAGRGLTPVMGIEAPDRLVAAFVTAGDEDVILMTETGQAIRFAQEEVRPMGLPAAGVAGIKLVEGETVIGAGIGRPKADVALISETAHAKRVSLSEYPVQRRYGTGVVSMKVGGRAGRAVGGGVVVEADELFAVTDQGKVHALTPAQLPQLSRPAGGRPVLALGAKERVQRLLIVGYGGVKREPAKREPAKSEELQPPLPLEAEPQAAGALAKTPAKVERKKGGESGDVAEPTAPAKAKRGQRRAVLEAASAEGKPAETKRRKPAAAQSEEPKAAGRKRAAATPPAGEGQAKPAQEPTKKKAAPSKSTRATKTAAQPATPKEAKPTKRQPKASSTTTPEATPAAKPQPKPETPSATPGAPPAIKPQPKPTPAAKRPRIVTSVPGKPAPGSKRK